MDKKHLQKQRIRGSVVIVCLTKKIQKAVSVESEKNSHIICFFFLACIK